MGQQWDGKLLVNAELNVTDADGPESQLYRAVFEKYGEKVSGGLGSFSQMGFIMAQELVMALESIKGEDLLAQDREPGDQGLKGFKTDMLCRPWYYGEAPLHSRTTWTGPPRRRTARW